MAKNHPQLISLATEELNSKGDALLAAGAYKEAIQVYKQLLKRQVNPVWQTKLAQAYLERAKTLATKGLYKEAAMLWENMANLGEPPAAAELYINWLVCAGQTDKAIAYYSQLTDNSIERSKRTQLDTLFAALLVAGDSATVANLPTMTALKAQQTLAQAALQAYCQNMAATSVHEHLQKISFRSPFRDLRQILNALLKLEQQADPTTIESLLARVATTSPFAALVTAIKPCLVTGQARLQALQALSPAQYELAVALLALSKPQQQLIKRWSAHNSQRNDKTRLAFIADNLSVLDNAQAQRTCLALLVNYPNGRKVYQQLFGPLPLLEEHRIAALRAEQTDDIAAAERHWQSCVNLLLENSTVADNKLSAALILRHLVDLLLRELPDLRNHPSALLIRYLEDSLNLDPDHQPSYLKVAEFHQKVGNRKAYQQWIERAIKRYPHDSAVLVAAINAARARSAFKKAAGYARQLLTLDPINSQARNLLIEAHLDHARKSIKAGKFHLAEKELTSAAQLERKPSGAIDISRGLLAYCQDQKIAAEHHLCAGIQLADSVLSAGLQLWLEADSLNLSPALFKSYLSARQHEPVNRQQLLSFMQRLNRHLDQQLHLTMALDFVAKPLQNAFATITEEQELRSICESLARVPHYQLLEACANVALQQQPQQPLFVYYHIYARADGNIHQVNDRDYQRLETALEQASEAKDGRALVLIEDFFHQEIMPPFAGPTAAGMGQIFDELADEFERLPTAEREKIITQLIDKLGEPPPELRQMLLGEELDDPPLLDFPGGRELPFDLPPSAPRKRRKHTKRKKKKKR